MNHAEYCAKQGTLLGADAVDLCCSRDARPLDCTIDLSLRAIAAHVARGNYEALFSEIDPQCVAPSAPSLCTTIALFTLNGELLAECLSAAYVRQEGRICK